MIISSVQLSHQVQAHPGGTDGNGCHRCLTNCGSYGLSTGQYHCHSSYGSSGGSSSSNGSTGGIFVVIVLGLIGVVTFVTIKNGTTQKLDNSKMIDGIEDIKEKIKDL